MRRIGLEAIPGLQDEWRNEWRDEWSDAWRTAEE